MQAFGPSYSDNPPKYPGVWFSFEEDGIGEALKDAQAIDRDAEVKRVFITQKDTLHKMQDALDEVAECTIMAGDIHRAVVKV